MRVAMFWDSVAIDVTDCEALEPDFASLATRHHPELLKRLGGKDLNPVHPLIRFPPERMSDGHVIATVEIDVPDPADEHLLPGALVGRIGLKNSEQGSVHGETT
jgi:hypothetical protein